MLDAVDIQAHWHLQDIDGIELGASRSLDLLRLLQEGLTNVFKHSNAQRVDVHLRRQGDQLQLHIDDDGVGLAQGADGVVAVRTGAGLASMRLRARRLGGELQVSPADNGTGTRLALVLPLMA